MSMKPECDSEEYWVYHNAWCFVSVQQLVGATTQLWVFSTILTTPSWLPRV